MSIRIRVLGPLSVWVEDEPAPLPAGRARNVLAVLALHRGEPVFRHRLIDAVWSDSAPATAATQLQGLVSALRRRLPAGTIETHGPAYLLQVEPSALDLALFQTGRSAARAASGAGRLAEAADGYRAALDLWRGAAFEGLDSAYLARHAVR
jgi:DNA-binding SARP family transcriptional activator